MRKVLLILGFMSLLGVCIAEEDRTELAQPKKRIIMKECPTITVYNDSVKVLVMVNPKKQIIGNDTHYYLNNNDSNSYLVDWTSKDLSDYPKSVINCNYWIIASSVTAQ